MISGLIKISQDLIYFERYQAVGGALQRIDPRVKLVSLITLVVMAVLVRAIAPLVILFATVTLLSVVSRIPLKFFLYRATFFIPIFAAVIALPLPFITTGTMLATISYYGYSLTVTAEGIYKAVLFTFRIWVCVAAMTLLVLTTRFSVIISAMERLRFPKVFILMLAVTYRFIHVFLDEAYRILLARESRVVGREGRRQILRSLAHIVGALFIRAYERGERVYGAMVARGYTGEARYIDEMRCTRGDWVFGGVTASVYISVILVQLLHLGGV